MEGWVLRLREQAAAIAAGNYMSAGFAFTDAPPGIAGLSRDLDDLAETKLAAQAEALRQAVVAGALAGGGLTVIANAPNPAGQSILAPWFPEGVSAWRLFLWALGPTLLALGCFVWVG